MNEMIVHPLVPARAPGLSLDEENLARDMWQIERKSASQIAAALGHVVTRNAIIGIATRRGWVGGSTLNRATKARIGVVVHARPAPQINRGNSLAGNSSHGVRKRFAPTVPRPVEKVRKRSVFIADLKEHHCRWVMGEVLDFKYCGTRKHNTVVAGMVRTSSFCPTHHALAYVKRDALPKKKAEGFRLPPGPVPNFY